MKLPEVLYVMPTEELTSEDSDVDSFLSFGWDIKPRKGDLMIAVPLDSSGSSKVIKWIYQIRRTHETKDKKWPLELTVKQIAVKSPRTWYELVRESQIRGLVQLSGAHGQGDRITHAPTIQMILEMLEVVAR